MTLHRTRKLAAIVALVSTLGLTGCAGSTSGASTSSASGAATAAAAPGAPGGTASNGAPAAPPDGQGGQSGGAGGPGGSTSRTTPLGTYSVSSGNATQQGTSYAASATNTSGVLITGGALTLTDATVTTTGDTSSSDESSFYGLNAGVLATAGTIAISGGTVTTSGSGANGVFAYGKAVVTLTGTKIAATGQYAHGIMASGGGTITATNVTASSTGANSGVIATDRGSGTITVTGGTYTTAGTDSPVLYSTGKVSATGITGKATGAEMGVIEGSNSITLTNSSVSGTKKSGFMLMQSMSGDAEGTDAEVTITGGSISQAAGPLFYVTNSSGTITLTGVKATATSGVLLKATADKWGTSGSNGGNAVLTGIGQTLSGDIVVDKISTANVSLTKGSAWTGAFDTAHKGKTTSLTLDATSTWTVTKDSYVGTLSGLSISGTSVTNIKGGGHTVYYDSATNTALGGKTYTLAGGGTLKPAS